MCTLINEFDEILLGSNHAGLASLWLIKSRGRAPTFMTKGFLRTDYRFVAKSWPNRQTVLLEEFQYWMPTRQAWA